MDTLGEQFSPYHTSREINDMGQINGTIRDNGVTFLRKLESIRSQRGSVVLRTEHDMVFSD